MTDHYEKLEYIGDNSSFNELWHMLKEDMNSGRVAELVVIARVRLTEEEKERLPGCIFSIRRYWQSEDSTVPVLGILQYMIQEIWEFAKNAAQAVEFGKD